MSQNQNNQINNVENKKLSSHSLNNISGGQNRRTYKKLKSRKSDMGGLKSFLKRKRLPAVCGGAININGNKELGANELSLVDAEKVSGGVSGPFKDEFEKK